MSQNETRSYGEMADRMRFWAIVALVAGIVASFGLTAFATDLGVGDERIWVLVRFIGKVSVYFGLPMSAALFVGAIIVRRMR